MLTVRVALTLNIDMTKTNSNGLPDIYLLTMGGTIDKDYPRLTSGYAFEFGDESAGERILSTHPNLGISYEVTSICKKDSLEVTDEDRKLLADAIARILEQRQCFVRFVVTHGTDTMVETAQYIQNCLEKNLDNFKPPFVISFTGATKPERFIDSDASFNVGCAVAATSACNPGSVVICMNGNVIPAESCVRDEKTGLFCRKE